MSFSFYLRFLSVLSQFYYHYWYSPSFWQHLSSLGEGSQPAKRAKAETGVGEGWGKRDKEFSQLDSQGGLAGSRRSVISQPTFDKQMNSATEPQSALFYSVSSREILPELVVGLSTYHCVLEPNSEEHYICGKIMSFLSAWEDKNMK